MIDSLNLDRIARTPSMMRSPLDGEALPFFSVFECASSTGNDVLPHDVSIGQNTSFWGFGLGSPPPFVTGHITQHLAELKAHAIVRAADVKT